MTFLTFKNRIEAWWRETYRVSAGNVNVSQAKPAEAIIDVIVTVNRYQALAPITSRFETEDDFELAIAAITDRVKRSLGSYYDSALI